MSSAMLWSRTEEAPAPPDPSAEPLPSEEEFYSSWSLFLICILLILSLLTSYYLQIKKIRAIHETVVSIFAGMVVGIGVRIFFAGGGGEGGAGMIRDMLGFKHTVFFNLLLPPIILNSGYELKQANFFRNFGSILTFAFFGTFTSAVGVGVLVYIYSFLGLESLDLTLLECLAFGSTLSATDPVTILAIFNQYKVDPKLYTIIFGESLLNDAVSIVMYETVSQFHGQEVSISSFFTGVGIFLLSFSTSMLLGVLFGLSLSLLLKHSSLHLYTSIESALIPLIAYTSYFMSNGLGMSGIVTLLFCGITMKHYAYHTMSRRTQRATRYSFEVLAKVMENFIFVYLGMALFVSKAEATSGSGSGNGGRVKPLFILVTTVSVIFTRYASVFPLSEMINLYTRKFRPHLISTVSTSTEDEIPHAYQMMIFWAGLRGAVGVALAAGFKGRNAETLRMTVLVVVVLTVLMFGGTTARMLEVLGIRTGVDDPEGDVEESDDEQSGIGMVDGRGWRSRGHGRSRSNSRRPRKQGNYRDNDSEHEDNYWNHHSNNSPRRAPVASSIPSSPSEYDSDGAEVLPLAPSAYPFPPTPGAASRGPSSPSHDREAAGTARERWFQTIDEQYLLPLFSNATASRSFHARKSMRNTHSSLPSPNDEIFDAGSDDEFGERGVDARTIVLGAAGSGRQGSRSGSGRGTPSRGSVTNFSRSGSPTRNGGGGGNGDRTS